MSIDQVMVLTLLVSFSCCLDPKCEYRLLPTVSYSRRDSSHPQSVAVGDFNSDGHMDVVVANLGFDNVDIFIGYGNNSFANQTTYSMGIGSTPRMVAVGDFNNDNRSDIAVANFGTHSIVILFGDGNGSFPNQTTIETSSSRPFYVVVGDFNNDRCFDVAFTGYGTNIIHVALGFGNGTFETILIHLFTGYDSLPYSMAVNDFNKDGRLDIAVTNSGTDNIGLFFGYGNGTFTDQIIYTTGAYSRPFSIAVADLNHDTYVDITIVNRKANNMKIFLGHGNGSFVQTAVYSTGGNSNPIFIAIADFNNDNKSDITIVNNGTNRLVLLFGYGDGTFADPAAFSTGPLSSPYSIGVADFNSDNQLDVVIANQQNNNIKVFNSYTTATFASEVTFPTSKNSSSINVFFISTGSQSDPVSLVISDFNNDNQLDIAVANFETSTVAVLLGSKNGRYSSPTFYSTGDDSHPFSIIVADFNNDDQLDLAVANVDTHNVGIFLGYGDGEFSPQITYFTGTDSLPACVAAGDFNKDGWLDIAVANNVVDNIGILLGNGKGEFSLQTTCFTGTGSSPSSIAIDDFNADGQLDMAVANFGTNNIDIFLGYGNGTFSPQTTYDTGTDSNPISIVSGDLNNDGILDLVVANIGSNNVGVFLGYGSGEFSSQTAYFTGTDSYPISVAVGDVNNDGLLDIGVANFHKNAVGIFLNYGNGTFSSQMVYPIAVSAYPRSIIINDFNKDNLADIVVADDLTNNIAILLGQGTGYFPNITYPTKTPICSMLVAVGDVNADGRQDVIVANYDTDSVGILRGYGDGSFESQQILSTGNGSSPSSIVVNDLNNDGRLDILVANSGTNNIGIFIGIGYGQFSSPITYSMGLNSNPTFVVTADFNNDSRLDIAVANTGTNNVCILLANTDGNFSSQHTYFTGKNSQPVYLAVVDFNNDDRLDIAVVNAKINAVGILLGHGNGTFQNQKTFSTGAYSNPTSLAVGDLDKDGDMDIVVANTQAQEEHILVLLGDGHGNFSNYGKYVTATDSQLCSVVIGHFNNDTKLDMAVANNGTKEIGIFLGYGDGTFSTQTNYLTTNNSRPISITIGDFNNDNLSDLAVANYGTQIVGIFLAKMDTNLVDKNTYFTGSAASPGSIALADYNNDNHLDIVVGNDGTHDIDLFINDGNGNFSVQTVYLGDSTFHPTSIVVHDFNSDTRLDLAIANSATDTITLLYGENNGTFPNSKVFPTGINSGPQSIAAGDFNHDNRTDIAVAYSDSGSVNLLLRIDTGALRSMKDLSTGSDSKPHGLTVADFDNDSRLDIAVANNGKANIQFFFGFGNGSFSEPITIFLGQGIFPQWVGSGDFNNDQHLDVVVSSNVSPTPVIVLLGDGKRSFRVVLTNGVGRTYMGAVGDFNGDSQLDVVLCQPWTDAIAILLGYGNGTFRSPTIYPTGGGSYPLGITVGDFNNDSRLDIAVVNPNNWNIGVILRHGDGTLANQILYATSPYGTPTSATTGDFDNDGRLDIAIGIYGSNSLGVLFGLGNGTFWPLTIYPAGDGSMTQWIDATDINNDGRLDIIVTNTDNSNLGIILGHANGTFFNRITYPVGKNSYPFSIGLGDFNNDSRIDVAVANMLSDNIGILLGYTSVDFVSTAATSIGEGSQPVSIAVGYFNNDMHLDVVVADPGTDSIVVLYGSGYGTFPRQKVYYSTGNGSDPNWVAVNDFNHDQYLDIAVVNSGTNNIAIFLGYKDGTFSRPTAYPTGDSSAPVSLTVDHFNDDVHLDLAVANFGNNNVCLMFGYGNGSFASPECHTSGYDSRPFAVASGDVNGDNLTDVVFADKGSSKIEILTKIC